MTKSLMAHLRTSVAIVELVAWLPASCSGLILAASYGVAGNAPPATLVAGFFLVPIVLLASPLYALSGHGRVNPRRAALALLLPVLAIALTYAAELPSLTKPPL